MDRYGILLGSQASGIFHQQHTDWGMDEIILGIVG